MCLYDYIYIHICVCVYIRDWNQFSNDNKKCCCNIVPLLFVWFSSESYAITYMCIYTYRDYYQYHVHMYIHSIYVCTYTSITCCLLPIVALSCVWRSWCVDCARRCRLLMKLQQTSLRFKAIASPRQLGVWTTGKANMQYAIGKRHYFYQIYAYHHINIITNHFDDNHLKVDNTNINDTRKSNSGGSNVGCEGCYYWSVLWRTSLLWLAVQKFVSSIFWGSV